MSALSYQTLELVAKIIYEQAKAIRNCEIQKEVLAQNHSFVVLNAFIRIDSGKKQKITTLDLHNFFRENGLIVSEADCFMLVKQFDGTGTGSLSLLDLTRILCPRSYTQTKNLKATNKFFHYGLHTVKLNYDVEYSILKVIEQEINCLKKVEYMK